MLPRGVRNNNPGNIRHSKIVWRGQSARQLDAAFVTFDTMAYGVRALAKNLLTYEDEHGWRTVRQIINHWAPPVENDTGAYVDAVATDCAVTPDEPLNLHDPRYLQLICKAICRHENGGNFVSQPDLEAGVKLALG